MKRLSLILSILAITLFIGCNNQLVAPSGDSTYNGVQIQDIEAPYLLNNTADESLGRLQIADLVPDGTVYGNVNDPDNVYFAQGGEILPAGSWVDNLDHSDFSTIVNSDAVLIFSATASVSLTDPVDMVYLDVSYQWHLAENSMMVDANGIMTGAAGSCSISTDAQFGIGGEGSDNAVLSYFGIGGEGSDNELLTIFGIGGEGSDNAILDGFGIGGEGSDNYGIGGEGSDNALLSYNGTPVTTTPAPFLLNANQLGLLNSTEVQLPLPAGTVYGHADYPGEVFLAVGGEALPAGAWLDNSYNYAFVANVNSATQVTFVDLAYVLITNATNTQYLNNDNVWVPVAGNAAIWTRSVMTSVDGGCIIDTGTKFTIGGEGQDNG